MPMNQLKNIFFKLKKAFQTTIINYYKEKKLNFVKEI